MVQLVGGRAGAARAFLRSLNILLKFARMYDFGHPRTAQQYETTWSELHAALGSGNETGLLLAVSGDQLLLDGVPLEVAAAEKSFARMLSSAGIASVHFSPKMRPGSLARFVRAFPTGTNAKPTQLAEQLKAALQNDPHIQVNAVCFVPADSAVVKSTVAAQLAARTIGMSPEKTDELFSDPQKLLQLIVAAEGNKNAANGADPLNGAAKNGSSPEGKPQHKGAEKENGIYISGDVQLVSNHAQIDPPAWLKKAIEAENLGADTVSVETGKTILQENELRGIVQALARIANKNAATNAEDLSLHPAQQFTNIFAPATRKMQTANPGTVDLQAAMESGRFTLSEALSTLAAQARTESSDKQTLLKLAEHVAVRFALDSYERGDVQVNAVRQTLDEMNQELDGLRKILGIYEEKMAQAGLDFKPSAEMLAQEFWDQVPEEKKKSVLESAEAWCVPVPRVREYVEVLRSRADNAAVEKSLRNYLNAVTNDNQEQRRQVAIGLAELAPLYIESGSHLFLDAIRILGVQLAQERDEALQSLVSAAFVRFSQEAVHKRAYAALQRCVEMVEYVESEQAIIAKSLRPRVAVENRLSDFIEEALKNGQTPLSLLDLMRRLPVAASEQIAARFGRASFIEDSEALLAMIEVLGEEAIDHLRRRLEQGEPSEASEAVGILARIDFASVEKLLPPRMKQWKRIAQDRVLRQIAASQMPRRGHLLLDMFDDLDPLLQPMAIDEIGLSREMSAEMLLLRIAEGDLPKGGTEYLRVKAIEALGNLNSVSIEAVLRKLVEARWAFRWSNPSELRLVALQALEKINPEWVRNFISRSGLSVAELFIEMRDSEWMYAATRQRRYQRLRFDPPVQGVVTSNKENHLIEVPGMSLSGGVLTAEHHIHPGSVVELRLTPGQKSIRMQAIIRQASVHSSGFEIVDISFEDRARLRKLLVQRGSAPQETSPEDRNPANTQTLAATQVQ